MGFSWWVFYCQPCLEEGAAGPRAECRPEGVDPHGRSQQAGLIHQRVVHPVEGGVAHALVAVAEGVAGAARGAVHPVAVLTLLAVVAFEAGLALASVVVPRD